MTITRVIKDGVEFFTLNITGEGAVSESGLARLCDVKHQSMNELVQRIIAGNVTAECLKPFSGKDIRLQATDEPTGMFSQIALIRADASAAIVEYYAYESRYKTESALFAFRKFAKMGIERWIQGITGWVDPSFQPPSPPPLPDLNLARAAIDILKNPNVLSANGYRLYLQIHDADQQHQRPTIAELCKSLKITRPTYHKALNLLDQFNLLPRWVITHNRRQPERFVRDWLQAKIGGQPEAPSPDGPIDLLTDEEVIEVKALHNWKDGIGHVLVKAQNYPDRHKCLLLFGEAGQNLEQIQKRCDEFAIQLGFVPIEFSYDERSEELQIQLLDPAEGTDQTIL
jgi:hypothetical protein